MKNFSMVLVSVLALGACGGDDGGSGGSGVSSSTQVKDLTAAQSLSLCHELAADWPQRTVTCSGQSQMFGVDDAECTSGSADPLEVPPTCTATVGDARACFKGLGMITDDQVCNRTAMIPASCAVIMSDACDSGDDGSGSGSGVTSVEEIRARALAIFSR